MVVDLTISRSVKALVVVVALSPLNVPISWVTARSPELSKANTLLALSVALVVNSALEKVLVTDALIERSTSSCNSCVIKVRRSRASSWLSAGKGSLAT